MFIHPARCSIGVAVAAKAEAACGCSPCAWLPLLCSVGLCTPLSQAPLPPATILPGVSPLVGWQVPLFFWKPPCATPDLAGDLHWIQPLGLHGSVCYRVVCWNLLIAGKWPSVCALSKKSKSPFPDYSPEALLHGKEANQGWKLEFTNLEKSIVFFFLPLLYYIIYIYANIPFWICNCIYQVSSVTWQGYVLTLSVQIWKMHSVC